MKRENYYNLIFAAISLLLIGVSLMAYWNVNNYMEEVKWVRHSNQVIAQVEKILSIVKDAETGHRGFQLTRDTIFLRPYKSSVESIGIELNTLDSLFLGDPNQKKRGDSLRLLIDKQYRIISTILLNEEQSKRYIDQYEINLLIVGRENMDRLRNITNRITTYENEILKNRVNQEIDLKNIAPFTLLMYGFVAIGVAGFLYLRINDELRRRRRTENELKEKMMELDQKERRYRSLFERSMDPIFLADENFRLIDANSSLEEVFQYSREEACQLNLNEFFIDNVQFHLFKEKIEAQNHVRDFEVVLRNSKGKKLICVINCVFIPDLSDQCCYQGIIQDISMRKRAERDLILAEKLSTTGKVARTIAHEVRNPLTNLSLALDQLKDEFPQNDSTNVYTDILDRNLNRIEELISELLRSSRPRDLQRSEVPLATVLNETIDLIKDRINLHEMKLHKNFEIDLPSVFVDKELIKIALVNIMVNAIEAMKPGFGVLTISTSCSENQVVVCISDNGEGIAEEELDNLFDPFYSAKQGGMGLGLTSTQNILNSHKIGVDVKSKVNEGTSFYISFDTVSPV